MKLYIQYCNHCPHFGSKVSDSGRTKTSYYVEFWCKHPIGRGSEEHMLYQGDDTHKEQDIPEWCPLEEA